MDLISGLLVILEYINKNWICFIYKINIDYWYLV